MKKQIIISMLVLLLVGIIIAQVALTRDIDVTLDKDTKDKLAEYNITNPKTTELVCDDKICEFKMYDGEYNLGSHTFSRVGLTNQQIINKQDETVKEWLEEYSQVLS